MITLLIVKEENTNTRLDTFIAQQVPAVASRTAAKKLIENKQVQVNQHIITKISTPVKTGDTISVNQESGEEPVRKLLHEHKKELANLHVTIVYQNNDFLIINKPAGLLTHATPTDPERITLVDWLVLNFPDIALVGQKDRAGIVHRLDKETSGIMIIALTNATYDYFVDAFKNRLIHKKYLALVKGNPEKEGSIDFPIGRHPKHRHKMHAFKKETEGKIRTALTAYAVLTCFEEYALVQVTPFTGRTHQIRVHMAAIKHPLIGDTVYGSASKIIKRHALHAHTISFTLHNQDYFFECPLPQDFQAALATKACNSQ